MAETELELDDIQSGVLRPRPDSVRGNVCALSDRRSQRRTRVDAPAAFRGRFGGAVRALAIDDTWVSVALSYQGLKALGVPQASLDSFSPEFQQGMAARAKSLGDNGESSPEHWEKPLGSPDVHVVITAVAPGTRAVGSGVRKSPRKVTRNSRASRRSGVRTVTCYPVKEKRSDSRTASVIPRSKDREFRAPILMNGR